MYFYSTDGFWLGFIFDSLETDAVIAHYILYWVMQTASQSALEKNSVIVTVNDIVL